MRSLLAAPAAVATGCGTAPGRPFANARLIALGADTLSADLCP